MKVVIMGCGRVGAELAANLERAGNSVTILDINPDAFRRLATDFRGRKVVGNGIDQDTLRRACADNPDAFVAVTQGDNRNVMAAQIARHILQVPRVVCRIYDPIREEIYRELGIETISPTRVSARLLMDALGRAAATPITGE